MNKPQQFYISEPDICPYIKGKIEQKFIVYPIGENIMEQFNALAEFGFRRSLNIAYKPMCSHCNACQAVRVIVDEFAETKSMKRIWNKNKDIIAKEINNNPTKEQFKLFQKYLRARHDEDGMIKMTFNDYKEMIQDSPVETKIIEFRKKNMEKEKNELLAAVLFDRMADHLSMVYSFFNPDENKRSLGTYIIMHHIRKAKKEGLPYCHLGYWIKENKQMEYKDKFVPQERFINTQWKKFD